MKQEIIDYINSQNVGVLAIEMLDGSPHASTLHYASTENPFMFYFETNIDYRKAEPILKNNQTRASFVIGTDGGTKKTLQMDGNITLMKPEEKEKFHKIYFEKFPNKLAKSEDPKNIFFTFTPNWWRYTDWDSPQGKLVIASTD